MTEPVARMELRSLTTLRFIAAAIVFLFHIEIRTPIFPDGMISTFFRAGAVGMTVFFVLSGFILAFAYDRSFHLREYTINRIARIVPIYALAALLSLPILATQYPLAPNGSPAIYSVLATTFVIFTSFSFLQAWFPYTFPFMNNSASWSISCESFFYAIFSFGRHLAKLDLRTSLLLFAALSLFSSFIPATSLIMVGAIEDPIFYYANPFLRLPEFLCGILCYGCVRSAPPLSMPIRAALCAVVILAILHVAFLGNTLPGYTFHNWIFIPGVAALITILFDHEKRGGSFATGALPVWLGKISYCFYSFQFHVLFAIAYFLPFSKGNPLLYLGLCTIVLVAVSALAFHFVEEPGRRAIRRKWGPPRQTDSATLAKA